MKEYFEGKQNWIKTATLDEILRCYREAAISASKCGTDWDALSRDIDTMDICKAELKIRIEG